MATRSWFSSLLFVLLVTFNPRHTVESFSTPFAESTHNTGRTPIRVGGRGDHDATTALWAENDDRAAADVPRRSIVRLSTAIAAVVSLSSTAAEAAPSPKERKCYDLESCREIGDRKVESDMRANPTTTLESGVRYKVLKPGIRDGRTVTDDSTLDLIFSISEGGGPYMYSRGFGYEKLTETGMTGGVSDLGLDSLRVAVGKRDVPVGIEQALVGMTKGERRRVELPPGDSVGFESSDWRPEPTTRRGKARIAGYQRTLSGFGSQPAFPAVTVWDVEVVKIRD